MGNKKIIAIVLAVLIAGGFGGFAYAQGNGHDEPMTGQKLVSPGFYAQFDEYVGDENYYFYSFFLITNPDCVSQIMIDRLFIFNSDGQVVYEGTPWSEPIQPHESRHFFSFDYVPDDDGEWMYTVEIFWTWVDDKGLPLTGWLYNVAEKTDEEGNLIEHTDANSHRMINMEQHLEPGKDKVK